MNKYRCEFLGKRRGAIGESENFRVTIEAVSSEAAIHSSLLDDGFDYVPDDHLDRSMSGDLDESALIGWEFSTSDNESLS